MGTAFEELKSNLSHVGDFSEIITLRELLETPKLEIEEEEWNRFQEFMDDSLIMVLSGAKDGDKFQQKFSDLIGDQRFSINDYIDYLERSLPNDHIQHKESKGESDD